MCNGVWGLSRLRCLSCIRIQNVTKVCDSSSENLKCEPSDTDCHRKRRRSRLGLNWYTNFTLWYASVTTHTSDSSHWCATPTSRKTSSSALVIWSPVCFVLACKKNAVLAASLWKHRESSRQRASFNTIGNAVIFTKTSKSCLVRTKDWYFIEEELLTLVSWVCLLEVLFCVLATFGTIWCCRYPKCGGDWI